MANKTKKTKAAIAPENETQKNEAAEAVETAEAVEATEVVEAAESAETAKKEPAKKEAVKKELTDADVKRKAVKLVVAHIVKKLPEDNFIGSENILNWIARFEDLLERPEFVLSEYFEMRRDLNDIIERTMDEDLRFKFRDSWFSLGKALDKKVKKN